jgi:hypothetical protein
MRRQRKFPEYLSTIGIDVAETEWEFSKLPHAEVEVLRARFAEIEKVILADWLRAARERAAKQAAKIAADIEDQIQRDEVEARYLDLQNSLLWAGRMLDDLLTPTDRLKLVMKARQREHERWMAKINKQARAKFKKRR